jgi:ribosomal protein L29
MNVRDSIKAIFAKHNIDPSAHGIQLSEQVALEVQGQLMDGSAIYTSADAFAVGADCYTKDDAGNMIPCVEGEYQLADGTMITIGADSKIAEMASPSTEQEMSSDDLLAAIESLSNRVAALEGEKTALESALASEKSKSSKASTEVNTLKAELSALRKSPAVDSVKSKVELKSAKKEVATSKPYAQMTLRERIQFNLENSNK